MQEMSQVKQLVCPAAQGKRAKHNSVHVTCNYIAVTTQKGFKSKAQWLKGYQISQWLKRRFFRRRRCGNTLIHAAV